MSADDDSKAPESEAATGQVRPRELESRIDGIVGVLDGLENRVDDLEAENEKLREQLALERQRRKDVERRLESQIDELDQRTDLLQLVETVENADAKQRSAALLQHIRRKASRLAPDDGPHPGVVVDHHDAEEALHYPDIHRSTLYGDMKRVVSMIDDSDVCWYDDGELWFQPDAQRESESRWSPTTGESGPRGQNPSKQPTDINQT